MQSDGPGVPEAVTSLPNLNFLNGCLMEEDPALQEGARKRKRRAVIVSVLIQLAFIAVLVLYPLLSKGEDISASFTPAVPHFLIGSRQPDRPSQPRPHLDRAACHFCAPPRVPPTIVTRDPDKTPIDETGPMSNGLVGLPPGTGVGVPFGDAASNSVGPLRPEPIPAEKRRISIGTIQPAMLVHRVEPSFPTLARQVHRNGRVELHAIIATDGSVQSLEVVGGDPLFFPSALAAVREWRYRPTILNGQAVEVDTHITVIYTVDRN